jgi:DNA-binding CsgD family transcriptional regulator
MIETLLQLLGQGYTYDEAARRMDISVHTAHTFSKRIYMKLEVGSKSEALAQARGRGWI